MNPIIFPLALGKILGQTDSLILVTCLKEGKLLIQTRLGKGWAPTGYFCPRQAM